MGHAKRLFRFLEKFNEKRDINYLGGTINQKNETSLTYSKLQGMEEYVYSYYMLYNNPEVYAQGEEAIKNTFNIVYGMNEQNIAKISEKYPTSFNEPKFVLYGDSSCDESILEKSKNLDFSNFENILNPEARTLIGEIYQNHLKNLQNVKGTPCETDQSLAFILSGEEILAILSTSNMRHFLVGAPLVRVTGLAIRKDLLEKQEEIMTFVALGLHQNVISQIHGLLIRFDIPLDNEKLNTIFRDDLGLSNMDHLTLGKSFKIPKTI